MSLRICYYEHYYLMCIRRICLGWPMRSQQQLSSVRRNDFETIDDFQHFFGLFWADFYFIVHRRSSARRDVWVFCAESLTELKCTLFYFVRWSPLATTISILSTTLHIRMEKGFVDDKRLIYDYSKHASTIQLCTCSASTKVNTSNLSKNYRFTSEINTRTNRYGRHLSRMCLCEWFMYPFYSAICICVSAVCRASIYWPKMNSILVPNGYTSIMYAHSAATIEMALMFR